MAGEWCKMLVHNSIKYNSLHTVAPDREHSSINSVAQIGTYAHTSPKLMRIKLLPCTSASHLPVLDPDERSNVICVLGLSHHDNEFSHGGGETRRGICNMATWQLRESACLV